MNTLAAWLALHRASLEDDAAGAGVGAFLDESLAALSSGAVDEARFAPLALGRAVRRRLHARIFDLLERQEYRPSLAEHRVLAACLAAIGNPAGDAREARGAGGPVGSRAPASSQPAAESLRLLLDTASEGIWAIDDAGRCVFANAACIAQLGFQSEAELLGRDMHALVHHHRADGTAFAARDCPIYASAHEGANVVQDHDLLWRKDGTSFEARYRAAPLVHGGQLAGTVVCFEDISARLLAERQRDESAERMRAVLAAVVEAVVLRDSGGVVRFVNQSAEKLFGLKASELVGSRFPDPRWKLLRADGVPCTAEDFPPFQALSTGLPQSVELRLVQQGGEVRPVAVHSQPLHATDSGGLPGTVTSFYDLSQLRRGETERQQLLDQADSARRLLEAVIEHIPLAVGIAEAPSGKILLANRWVERILRHRPPATGGIDEYTQWSCVHADGSPLLPSEYPLARAVAHGETVHAEPIDYIFGDGTRGTIEVSAAPILDAAGKITSAVVVYGDITPRRKQEEQARRRAEFEQHLIGIVSHDLRIPLSAISLSAELGLRQCAPGDAHRPLLERIQRSVRRASRMVRDLLDFTQARLGAGIPVSRVHGSLAAITQQVIDEMREAHPQRRIDFDATGPAEAEADQDRIAQALGNLLANAVAFSPPGSAIAVRVRESSDELRLEVRNEGPPIPPALLPRIFEPLRRGSDRGEGSGGSLGLGLYIVDQILRAHGGTVEVRSTETEGTTFSLRLPRPA